MKRLLEFTRSRSISHTALPSGHDHFAGPIHAVYRRIRVSPFRICLERSRHLWLVPLKQHLHEELQLGVSLDAQGGEFEAGSRPAAALDLVRDPSIDVRRQMGDERDVDLELKRGKERHLALRLHQNAVVADVKGAGAPEGRSSPLRCQLKGNVTSMRGLRRISCRGTLKPFRGNPEHFAHTNQAGPALHVHLHRVPGRSEVAAQCMRGVADQHLAAKAERLDARPRHCHIVLGESVFRRRARPGSGEATERARHTPPRLFGQRKAGGFQHHIIDAGQSVANRRFLMR